MKLIDKSFKQRENCAIPLVAAGGCNGQRSKYYQANQRQHIKYPKASPLLSPIVYKNRPFQLVGAYNLPKVFFVDQFQ